MIRAAAGALGAILLVAKMASAQPAPPPILIDQCSDADHCWTPQERAGFYSRNQGSRIMPLSWFKALRQRDGQPFLADQLSRYGYLANDTSPYGLPVGFTLDKNPKMGEPAIGMTCAACHTRELQVQGQRYRIDGGPALVDFQRFLQDIDASVGSVLSDGPTFTSFAHQVLGTGYNDAAAAKLRQAVTDWYQGYHALISRSLLPATTWGYGRLDAVSMIFNRLIGLDLGQVDDIKEANAPTRYPFLWNAAIQDHTQWPGFAVNGLNILGLARNTGEVFGVFGVFQPQKFLNWPNYLKVNSVDFKGLDILETSIRKLGTPKWPDQWGYSATLAQAGKQVFQQKCAGCHGVADGVIPGTWKTPIQAVGTDTREFNNLTTESASGILAGTTQPPFIGHTLGTRDKSIAILTNAVLGSILQDLSSGKTSAARVALLQDHRELKANTNPTTLVAAGTDALRDFNGDVPASAAYESRVLKGIWAAAPYLHNGSVASLAELLTPADQRLKSFAVGPAYDPQTMGLAKDQPVGTIFTAGECDSGNGNCGHSGPDFGTDLSDADKRALLEYMKSPMD